MTRFHTDEYVDFLTRVTPETVQEMTGNGSSCEFVFPGGNLGSNASSHVLLIIVLVGEDCPAFEGLFEFCSISAGGSVST